MWWLFNGESCVLPPELLIFSRSCVINQPDTSQPPRSLLSCRKWCARFCRHRLVHSRHLTSICNSDLGELRLMRVTTPTSPAFPTFTYSWEIHPASAITPGAHNEIPTLTPVTASLFLFWARATRWALVSCVKINSRKLLKRLTVKAAKLYTLHTPWVTAHNCNSHLYSVFVAFSSFRT